MAEYEADHVRFAKFMLSPNVRDLVKAEAEEMATDLRATTKKVTGNYASNFRVETGVDRLRGERAAAFVVNDSDYATALEVGSWNISNPPMPMTRALERYKGGG